MLAQNLFITAMISILLTYLIWTLSCWGSTKRKVLNLVFGMFPIFFALVDIIYGIEMWRKYDSGIQFLFFFACYCRLE